MKTLLLPVLAAACLMMPSTGLAADSNEEPLPGVDNGAGVTAAEESGVYTYLFTQEGFTGGGILEGFFTCIDLDGDGQIYYFSEGGAIVEGASIIPAVETTYTTEVIDFGMTFSGDSIVGDFSHAFPDLSGLVYDLNSPYLGDGLSGGTEGIASNWDMTTTGFEYASGRGPTGMDGGHVKDLVSGAMSLTEQLVVIQGIPEPSTVLLLLGGLVVLAVARRRI